jgi:hypothetical protein
VCGHLHGQRGRFGRHPRARTHEGCSHALQGEQRNQQEKEKTSEHSTRIGQPGEKGNRRTDPATFCNGAANGKTLLQKPSPTR